jgi:glycosyltransferase involved in cell wall biosynthesis
MESVKVVHLIKTTGIAGAETHLLALLPALREYGVRSELILLEDPRRPQAELQRRMEAGGVPVTRIPIRWHIDPALPGRLRAELKRREFDLLHAHLPHGEWYGELALRAFPGKPFLMSRHNDDRFRRWLPVRWMFAASIRRASVVIAISKAVERFLVAVERVPSAKVVCIPYGLDAAAYARQAVPGALRAELAIGDRPLVFFVGRLTAQKGVDTLLAAFADVERKMPGAFLALAGDGPLRGRLEREAVARGLRNVRFLGWRADVPRLMPDADLLVMPSRWEGFGLIALEAMAMAKPVVASRVSALPEIVEEAETGFLVPPDQPAPLADAILRVLEQPDMGRAMGLAGRMRAEHFFPLDRMAESTALEYRRSLSI